MPIPTFTPGYPPDGSSLGQTKAPIRNNIDGTFQTVAIDHVDNNGSPGAQPAGYHTVIHQVPQASVATAAGYNQIFSGVPGALLVNAAATPAIPNNGDQQLYSLSGTGVLSQLTGKSAAANGYAWIGGILLQWGSGTATNTGAVIPFPIAFPNSVFSVVCTVYNSGSAVRSVSEVNSASVTSFTAISNNSTNLVYFMAVGI